MSSAFTLDESVYRGLVYIALSGEIDQSVSDTIHAVITDHLSTDATAGVVVDLGAVTFLATSGISALVKGHRLAAQKAELFRVLNAQGNVLRILDLTGVSAHLGLHEMTVGCDAAEMS